MISPRRTRGGTPRVSAKFMFSLRARPASLALVVALLGFACLLTGVCDLEAAQNRAHRHQNSQGIQKDSESSTEETRIINEDNSNKINNNKDGDELESAYSLVNKFFTNVLQNLRLVRNDGHHYASSDQNNSLTGDGTLPAVSYHPPWSPVLLVPGYGGSKLEARWRRAFSEHKCRLNSDGWRLIWCDPSFIPHIRCLVELFKLEFDRATNRTYDTLGVEVRVKTPDSMDSVEIITETRILPQWKYFHSISGSLVDYLGYTRDLNLRAAPYDFRKAPNELESYFAEMGPKIEEIYHANEQRPISFICHSMGCNNALYFLQRQSKEWKSKYVRRLISLAAPWAGAMKAFRAAALGDDLRLPWIIDEQKLHVAQRSLPSTMYLFPNQLAFGDQPIVRTHAGETAYWRYESEYPSREGESFGTSAEDYEQLFKRLQHPDGHKMYLLTKDLLGQLEAPQVEVWCLFSRGHATLRTMEFSGEFPNSRETKVMGDGDGTVPTESLEYCSKWADQQSEPVNLREFHSGHQDILNDRDVIGLIKQILDEE